MSDLNHFQTKKMLKLTETEAVLHKSIEDSDGYTSYQLSRLTRIDQSAVDAALHQLEKKGEITRQFHHSKVGRYFIYVSAQTGRSNT